MKANLQPDHIRVNKFTFAVNGLIPLTVMSVGALEEMLDTVDLPDRTRASGGRTQAIEFDIEIPAHHLEEQAAMEAWFKEGQDPVSPTVKKIGTLTITSGTGLRRRAFTLVGTFVTGRGLPDLDQDDEGVMANVKWPMSVDQMIPI